jgi:NitT/TauT family transport system permease protein
MAAARLRTRTVLGGVLSFLALAALIALFFAYREHARELHAPRFPTAVRHLPYYAFCSFYRMLAAYVLALVFSIVYGLAAARGKAWERVLIPAIDIAQSVPVVGFFPAAVYFFIALGHGSRLGVEMAAIFLIFTSQAWNMTLGVYEAVKTIPGDSIEALEAFGVTGWLKLKRLLLPVSVPKLVYNSILSWVSGWYFLIACEIITVGPAKYRLPGLGSFLMEAADRNQWLEFVAGLAILLAIIVAMDAIVWQPLSQWAEKFRYEFAAAPPQAARSLVMLEVVGAVGPFVRRLVRVVLHPLVFAFQSVGARMPRYRLREHHAMARLARVFRATMVAAAIALFAWAVAEGAVALIHALSQPWPSEVRLIPEATVRSVLRIVAAYLISLGWTVPCALVAAENPRFMRFITPAAEIVGSMPATALFPLIVVFVINVTGEMNLASILLILTGMQWYVLFNLLAGVNQIPEDLKEAARSFGLSRWERWRKLTLPAVMPSLITGSLTAWGGGWNALILSEYFIYQGHTYKVIGLGALLDEATYGKTESNVMILVSLLSMVGVVILLNRIFWRPLYGIAAERYRLDY